ncbi:MAG TPA: urease accessory protein UreH [Candidatus Polarisedimenticolia bacterium]|nr:urease accessory protein UreH [Candidatus Polarisedimenticolia bacterium]
MTDASLAATLLVGFLLGLRHALDADHVAAVAAIVSGRDGVRRSVLTGVFWGLGHALTIGGVGLVLLALRATVPPRLALFFEFAVAVVLMILGGVALAGVLRGRVHAHRHEHDGVPHAHLHFHAAPHGDDAAHRHPHPLRAMVRPFLVGTLHGLAGSGALVLLVLATVPTLLLGCLYLGIFGAGSIAGMALMSLALAAPLVLAQRRVLWLYRALRGAAGLGSLGLGLLLAWRIGRAGLFH